MRNGRTSSTLTGSAGDWLHADRATHLEFGKRVEVLARELGEALEQQAATSGVLRVISNSPGELELVFQTMLANPKRRRTPSMSDD